MVGPDLFTAGFLFHIGGVQPQAAGHGLPFKGNDSGHALDFGGAEVVDQVLAVREDHGLQVLLPHKPLQGLYPALQLRFHLTPP